MIEQKDESVTFSTTDLDIQIRTSAPVGVSGAEGTFTVSAQKTSEILGHPLRMLSPLCIRDAAIIGSAAFLDPCIKISPLREALPVTWISSNLLLPKSLLLYSLWLFLLYVTPF